MHNRLSSTFLCTHAGIFLGMGENSILTFLLISATPRNSLCLSFVWLQLHYYALPTRQMLKAPPLISRTCISWYYKIDPTKGHKICSKKCSKSSKIRQKVINGICPIKKVDNDAVKVSFRTYCMPPILQASNLLI